MINERNELAKLPKGWVWTTIEDILLSLESGGRPKGGVKNIKEGIPSIGGEHLSYNGSFNFTEIRYIPREFYEKMTKGYIRKKDVLVVKDGATTGKTAFVSDSFPYNEAAVNEHVFILRVFEDYTIPKYLFFWMQSSYGQKCVKDNFQGTAQGGINTLFVKNSYFPLPPLPEQRRIVAKIEELFTKLDAGIEALKKIKSQLKRYRQAVLKYAFEGKLTEEWRKVNKPKDEIASSSAHNDSLPELPKGWERVKLGDTVKIVSGNTPKGLDSISNRGNIPFYKVKDMNTKGNEVFMRIANLNITIDEAKKLKIRIFPKGTIIFPKRGGAILTNKKRILSQESSFDLNLMGAIPQNRLNGMFLYYWFQKLDLCTIYDGSNVPQINNKNIDPLPFSLPPPTEQSKIVDEIERRFSVADEIEKVVDQSLKQAERLRQSILKRAFEGKLVPQWADLPAPQPGKYWVYVVKCSNDSNYIGQTDNLRKRWEEHLSGTGADWTKRYPPQSIIYWEEFSSREEAVAKEKWLKTGFGRKWIKREEKAGRLWHAGEPASILLERIKAEKAKRDEINKTRKTRLPRPKRARNDK